MYCGIRIKSENFFNQLNNQGIKNGRCFSESEDDVDEREGGGGGGGARRCARNAVASTAHAPPPTPTAASQVAHSIKVERLSPHESSASRSRSVTPSTSSYPGTPPERGSPHTPAQPSSSLHPPRNFSDYMRSLAAKHNTTNSDYFHRINGFADVHAGASLAQLTAAADASSFGLFTRVSSLHGGPPRLPAFTATLENMTSVKSLIARARAGRRSRSLRKRIRPDTLPEHSPLDLSAAGDSAAKRARLSASPSTGSGGDDRDRLSNEDRNETRGECLCAEACARLSGWSVDEVYDFVNSIDICAEYAANFREQRIDGAGLPLLTEDHLTGMLEMKLGPALKLRSLVARQLEPCGHCQAKVTLMNPAVKLNGTMMKPEPRSNTTSPS